MASLDMVVRAVISMVLAAIGAVLLGVIVPIRLRPLKKRSAIVLVLGDIGRSPRMMYHAQSLASHSYTTTFIGYPDTPPISSLTSGPHVTIRGIANPPKPLLQLPWVFRAPIRIIWQILSVLYLCLWAPKYRSEYMLVQNPPSIPTLALAKLVGLVCGTKIIVDWHNTGYSILALRTGEQSLLCKIAKWFEGTFGRTAYAHLFVTHALKDHLVKQWDLQGRHIVLHDRPPAHFKRTPAQTRSSLLARILPAVTPLLPPSFDPTQTSPSTALLISSTSWTPDEDFTPLLQALEAYHFASLTTPTLPNLLLLITGKGSLRKPFEDAIRKHETEWTRIKARCVFLPAADYPLLLGSADLGVSMHSSSSGWDLPMKVVDMFGCGVPVLSKGFEAVGELVKAGQNGQIWNTGKELGDQMIDSLDGYPENKNLIRLQAYFERQNGSSTSTQVEGIQDWSNWDDNWDNVVFKPLLS